jgi:drug/metabolite transporter superfamily protein YnfA
MKPSQPMFSAVCLPTGVHVVCCRAELEEKQRQKEERVAAAAALKASKTAATAAAASNAGRAAAAQVGFFVLSSWRLWTADLSAQYIMHSPAAGQLGAATGASDNAAHGLRNET